MTDVVLRAQGTLLGQVVNSAGVPASNVTVTVRAEGKDLATGVTDPQGFFAFSGLRNGVCELATDRGGACVRAWDAKIAPPCAQAGAMIVVAERDDHAVVRGQKVAGATRRTTLLAAALGAGIGAGGAVAFYENQRSSASSD